MSYRREEPEHEHKPSSEPTILYWGELSHADGTSSVSPNFTFEEALNDWLDAHERDGDARYAARREIRPSGTFDTPLNEPPPVGDRARLEELIGGVRTAVTGAARRFDLPPARAASTDVTESEAVRDHFVRVQADTRAQRDSEPRLRAGSAIGALRYEDVYDDAGRVRPEYEAEVMAMRDRTRTTGRAT